MSDPLTTEDLDRIAHCAATWGAVSEPDVAKLVAEVRRLKALDTKPEPTIAELAGDGISAALFLPTLRRACSTIEGVIRDVERLEKKP